MTIAEIAQAVEPSKSTVRYWLTRHGLKTGGRRGRRASEQVRVASIRDSSRCISTARGTARPSTT
jgi:transposase-like protein